MIGIKRHWFRALESGSSTVEFAIVLPMLLMIVFGTIQFGIAYNRMHGLQAAAREGARLASVGAPTAEVAQRARDSQSLFDDSDVNVAITLGGAAASNPPCRKVGEIVEVTVSVPPSSEYAITIPLFGSHNVNYSSTASFRCERNGSA